MGVGVGALCLCLGHSHGEGPRDWWAGECQRLTAPPPCSGDPIHQVVWGRGGLQRDGHGAAGAQPRGPLQLLLPQVQPQDRAAPGRPDGESPHLLPRARGTLGTQPEDAGAGSRDSDMGPGPGDLDHQPWLGEEVLKHRLPVPTPDLLSWAPTEGLGRCPRATVKPWPPRPRACSHAAAIGELLGLVLRTGSPRGVIWDTT